MTVNVDTGPTEQLVIDRFESSKAYADQVWQTAKSFLEQLGEGSYSLSMQGADTSIDPLINSPTTPAIPAKPSINIDIPSYPSAITVGDIAVPHVDTPSFDAQSPAISYPAAPSTTWPTAPGSPPKPSYLNLPTPPSYSMPGAPAINDVRIPSPPPLNIPGFEGTLPVDNIDPPSSIFEYNEPEYESLLKSTVESKLEDLVKNGGTGLATNVETALWERAKDRLALKNEQMYDEAEKYFSSRGFTLPPGALSGRLSEIQKEQARAEQQINYEISIEQAKLAQTNTHFAITSVIQQEANVMAYITSRNNRMLDAAKYVQEAAISIFNSQVANYAKKLAAYQTSTAVYESRIRAEGLTLENYKTQIEGAKLTTDVQRQKVEIYGIQVSANNALATIYRTGMEAVRIQAEVERSKMEGFKAKTEAYNAGLNAIVSTYNAYQARIAGEVAKASVYTEQVKAYSEKVNAKREEAEVNVAEANAKVEANKIKVESLKANVARANAELAANIAKAEAEGKFYGYDIDRYRADISKAVAEANAEIGRYQAESSHIDAVAKLDLAQTEVFLDNVQKRQEMELEKAKSGATIAAQMAASAMSAVAAGAQLNVRTALSAEEGEFTNHNLSV